MHIRTSRRHIWQRASIGFIALAVGLSFYFVDIPAVLKQLQRTNWRYGLLASGMLMIGLIIYTERWRLLLPRKVTFRKVFHASNIGHLLNIWLPLNAGGPARIIALGQSKTVSSSEVVGSVLVERWLEQVMRLIALGGAIVFGLGLDISLATMLGGPVLLVLSLGVMIGMVRHRAAVLRYGSVWLGRLPWVTEAFTRRLISGLLNGLASVDSARQLALGGLWSLITWSCFFGFHYLALMALALDYQPQQMLALSLGTLALAPPSAATLPGIYHASIVVPLSIIGYDTEILTSYAVVLHALQMLWMSGLGIWGLRQADISFRELWARTG